MRSFVRVLIAISGSVLLPVAVATPSLADGGGGAGGTATAYVDETGAPTAEAREVSTSPRRSSRSGSDCEWRVVIADDTEMAMYDDDGNRVYSDTGRWLERWCDGQQVLVGGGYAVPERSRSVSPAALAQEARESIPIPSPPILTSPQADRGLYTRVRTWLWIPKSWWIGYSATAEAGGVSTTVSATPVRAVWSMGDGGQTVCEGPGVEWREGMSDEQTYCSYVYKNASSGQQGGTYTMIVTVEFEVAWTSNISPGGGLARVTRSASRTVEVGEIQAIETG